MSVKRVRAVVSGRVQGVGYRYFATHAAQQRGIVGAVRNLDDGSVEVIAEGDEDAVQGFLADLRRGPTIASVTALAAEWLEPSGDGKEFVAIG